jgi:hypothetical protein
MTEVIKEYDYKITNPKTGKTRTKHIIRKYFRQVKKPRELKPNETIKTYLYQGRKVTRYYVSKKSIPQDQ